MIWLYTVCLTNPLKDTWVVSSLRLLWIKLPQTFMPRLLHEHSFSFLLDQCPDVQLLGRTLVTGLVFRNLPNHFPGGLYLFIFQQCVSDAVFPHPHQHLVLALFSILVILIGVPWCLIVVCICISVMPSDVERLLMYPLVIHISSLEKYLFGSFVHF